VMAEEVALRNNRLAILQTLKQFFTQIADLSSLSVAVSDEVARA